MSAIDTSHRPRRAATAAALLAAACLAAEVTAQQPVDLRVDLGTGQTGRMFDANPLVGGGGYNYTRPASPLLGGNLYASGLAGRGFSLRTVSPIPDPWEFRGTLGSSSLLSFRRDAVGLGSVPLGRESLVTPYFDPSATLPTSGLLQGYTGGTAAGGALGTTDYRIDYRLIPQFDLGAELRRTLPEAARVQPPYPWAGTTTSLESLATRGSIFGTPDTTVPTVSLPTDERAAWEPRFRQQPTDDRDLRLFPQDDRRVATGVELPGWSRDLGSPLDAILQRDRVLAGATPGAIQPGLILPDASAGEAQEPILPVRLPPPDAAMLPGFEVYTDLALAAALAGSADTSIFEDMQQAIEQNPSLTEQVAEEAARNVKAFLEGMLNTPLRTFTGAGSSALNDQMLKAESLMQIGHFQEAAGRYEAATLAAPHNPLPLLGRGHALLAAGNYRSAADALLRGIALAEQTPGVASLLFRQMDLTALMGKPEIIDMRRSDLMARLDKGESPELRFLLGYLEYHTGDRERGLANLEQAAEHPRSPAAMSRYPALLRVSPQPPELPPIETLPDAGADERPNP